MRASIRHITSIDVPDLKTWRPGEENFAVNIRLLAGPDGAPGEESFDMTLCTPGWLAARARDESIVDTRHHLVVAKYDYQQLENYLRKRVAACEGSSWEEVAHQLGRLGYWEFEDYRE